MEPSQTPATSQGPSAQSLPPVAPAVPVTPPWYRQYWLFAVVLLVFWPAGLIIMATGPIFRKQKDGQFLPIKKLEKILIALVIIAIESFAIYAALHTSPKNPNTKANSMTTSSSMKSWIDTNKQAYNNNVDKINGDLQSIKNDSSANNPNAMLTDCQNLRADAGKAKQLPVMPDQVAQGYYTSELNDYVSYAYACDKTINNNDVNAAKSAGAYLQDANTQLAKLQDRFAADGGSVQ